MVKITRLVQWARMKVVLYSSGVLTRKVHNVPVSR